MDAQTLALFPVWYAAFLLSLTCHEAGHALVARWGGDDTAYLSGQVSLNPWPHIRREPLGTILVPILTYFMGTTRWMMGWASAPYDPRWEDRHPARAALMSAAGPLANFILFALAFAALRFGLEAGVWMIPQDEITVDRLVAAAPGAAGLWDAAGRFLSVVMCLNLILGVFNLMPFPPLDGIGVVSGLVSPVRSVYRQWRAVPAVAIVGVILAWRISPFVIGPVLRAAVSALLGG
jgi:Zn-dependent protease